MIPIPIGIGERIRQTGKGKFHCPNCGADRDYVRDRRAQYFYLCFVPLIPLNEWPERVTCQNCCSEFDKRVFFFNPEIEREEKERRLDRIKLVMILTLLREKRISEAAIERIEAAFEAEGGETMSREDLVQEIDEVRQMEIDPFIDLIEISHKLKPTGPSTVLQYAWLAAASNGTVSEHQSAFLHDLREALGVSEGAFNRLVARLSQPFNESNSNNSQPPS